MQSSKFKNTQVHLIESVFDSKASSYNHLRPQISGDLAVEWLTCSHW